MATSLRVLIADDSENDALLLLRELKQGGYAPTYERVDSAEAMTAALDRQAWDLVLGDHVLVLQRAGPHRRHRVAELGGDAIDNGVVAAVRRPKVRARVDAISPHQELVVAPKLFDHLVFR